MNMTFEELHKISSVSEDDIRSVFMALGADLLNVGSMTLKSAGNQSLPPSRALAVLLYHWLTRSGHARDHSLAVVQYLRGHLNTVGPELELHCDDWEGPLWIVMVQDGQYITSESDIPAFDFKKSRTVEHSDLPLPVMFQGLSLVGAYLRTLSTIRSQRESEASSESVQRASSDPL